MSWSSLPNDVVEVILSSLSLVELARVAATCGTFQAVYRRQLAREHEARCGLAVNYFGRKRITNITALIIQLLKGEPLNPSFYDPPHIDALLRGAFTFDLTAPTVLVFRHHSRPVTIITVEEIFPTWKRLVVEVPRDRKGVQICLLPPGDDKHVEMLALVHAILSEGLAQFIHDAGMWCQVDISRHWWVLASLVMSTLVGSKAQIGPLMQFASHCICVEPKYIDMGLTSVVLRYRLRIGEVEPAADEKTL